MKDSVMTTLKPGDIVVVKPSARNSQMRLGFVLSTTTQTARVVSMAHRWWWRKDESERSVGNFQSNSVLMIKERKSVRFDHNFPKGFPEELKEEYFEHFSDFDKTDTV